ncbi:MAG: hypothetical protein CL680_17240 [Blastomonas sp.]|nr:hypothetical protein [Blastomonas sp.]
MLGEAAAIPKPYVELVISLGDGHEWSAGERATGFAGGWITPIQTGPRFSRSLGVTRFVAARLHPDAAILLFGPLPLGDGAPPVLAEDVIGRDFRDLRDRLGEQSHPAARIDLLQAWVARRLPPPPAGLRVAPAEPWRAEQLCQLLGWTDRDLRRRFARTIGCSQACRPRPIRSGARPKGSTPRRPWRRARRFFQARPGGAWQTRGLRR